MIGIRRYGSVNSCSAPMTLMITTRMMAGRIIGSLIRVTIRLVSPRQRPPTRPRRGDGPERGVENYDGKAGPFPDGDEHDDPEQVARPEEVGVGKAEVGENPGEHPTWVCNMEAHIDVATTAGTANGRKKMVRKNLPNRATPRSNMVAKKAAMIIIMGTCMAAKSMVRPIPSRTRPQLGPGVVGEAAEDSPADQSGSEETGVNGVDKRDHQEHEENNDKGEDEPQAPPVAATLKGPAPFRGRVLAASGRGRPVPSRCSSTPPIATWAKFALPRSR